MVFIYSKILGFVSIFPTKREIIIPQQSSIKLVCSIMTESNTYSLLYTNIYSRARVRDMSIGHIGKNCVVIMLLWEVIYIFICVFWTYTLFGTYGSQFILLTCIFVIVCYCSDCFGHKNLNKYFHLLANFLAQSPRQRLTTIQHSNTHSSITRDHR